MFQGNHIAVCICTYQRPQFLSHLLETLQHQETDRLFSYSIVVVDNDSKQSAFPVFEAFKSKAEVEIRYAVEPEQNIALARNKAVENANGNFVAFIDDDEFPSEQWLFQLFKAFHYYHADGVLGPVLPCFEKDPPGWVSKGHFFEFPTHPTGQILGWKNTRTGNVLLKKDLFRNENGWFDPVFGSGGEDREFFRRKIEEGHLFIWCNEAKVFETVSAKRWKKAIMLRRALLRGKMAIHAARSKPISILKSILALVLYTCCLPFVLFMGFHVFMKYLIKDCDHLGKILALFGIDVVREKYIGGQ